MKKLLAKIRNKRLKGNISLLVILILLASSVISLLSINQIQRLITYWNQTFYYFRAFYLAKAWTELGLTEVYHSEAWFEHTVNSWSIIVSENLVWIYSGFNPYFNMNISWNFLNLTKDIRYTTNNDCKDDNKIILGSWEWIMLSLFRDDTGKSDSMEKIFSDKFTDKTIAGLSNIDDLSLKITTHNPKFTFAFFTYIYESTFDDYVMNNIVVKTWSDLNSFLDRSDVRGLISDYSKKYLTIKNSWDWPVEFCVNKKWNLIPYSDSLITVFWHYGDMEVWIQSVVRKWVPDWTLNVIDN